MAAPRGRRLPRPERARRGETIRLEHLEGRQPVLEALRAGRRRVRRVFVQEGLPDRGSLAAIKREASARGVRVLDLPAPRLSDLARTDAPQGVIAECDPLPLADLLDLVEPAPALVVVLDGIVDPRNAGATARSAEAFGSTGMVLSRHGASPLTAAAAKAAAGAFEYLPVAIVAGVPSALRRLKDLGLWLAVLDPRGPTSLHDLHLAREPLALVVGAEGKGPGRLTRELCDVDVRVPLSGRIGSLNAATAAALALYEVRRVRMVAIDHKNGV